MCKQKSLIYILHINALEQIFEHAHLRFALLPETMKMWNICTAVGRSTWSWLMSDQSMYSAKTTNLARLAVLLTSPLWQSSTANHLAKERHVRQLQRLARFLQFMVGEIHKLMIRKFSWSLLYTTWTPGCLHAFRQREKLFDSCFSKSQLRSSCLGFSHGRARSGIRTYTR